MDPQYSVLLGDEADKGECGTNVQDDKKNGINTKIIAIVVPVVVGAFILVGVGVLAYPRYIILIVFLITIFLPRFSFA